MLCKLLLLENKVGYKASLFHFNKGAAIGWPFAGAKAKCQWHAIKEKKHVKISVQRTPGQNQLKKVTFYQFIKTTAFSNAS